MVVRQHALTVVAPIRDDAQAPKDVAAWLAALEDPVIAALKQARSVHFARFVLLGTPPGNPAPLPTRLAFETNYDGELTDHLRELAEIVSGLPLDPFSVWKGYAKGQLEPFVAAHGLEESTFYLGHPGLSVTQIQQDRDLRLLLEELLDVEQDAGRVKGSTAVALRARLLAGLASSRPPFRTGAVDRGYPAQPWTCISYYAGVVPLVLFAAVVLLPYVLLLERRDRAAEQDKKLVAEDDPRLEAISDHEDAIGQNGLTHYAAMRPGPYRLLLVKAVLWFVEETRRRLCYLGSLHGISSIHFARWVLLGDGTLLFFSNYDGSWESYLGDFVDKAHLFLSAVWGNTVWFPDTYLLIQGGAKKESSFKQWTRTCQLRNQIWYSAYPDLTVSEINRNAQLREGASGEMDEEKAQKWLARL